MTVDLGDELYNPSSISDFVMGHIPTETLRYKPLKGEYFITAFQSFNGAPLSINEVNAGDEVLKKGLTKFEVDFK